MFSSTSVSAAMSLPYPLSATSPRPSTSASVSSACSSGTSTQSTSPTLLDLPTPPSAPLSTPSPLASSSLALPFTSSTSMLSGSPPMHAFEAFETSLSGLPSWSATIDPSLLFGLDPSWTKVEPREVQVSGVDPRGYPARTSFPPGSPILSQAERESAHSVHLSGESTTQVQRREQIAALSSLLTNGSTGPRSASSGPSKRMRSARSKETKQGRRGSLSTGRPAGVSGPPSSTASASENRGRRASAGDEVVPSLSHAALPPVGSSPTQASPSRTWLDALREAEAKAKLTRMHSAAAVDMGAPRGRLALVHGQLLAAQSMRTDDSKRVPVSAAPPPPLTGGGLSVFPWGHL